MATTKKAPASKTASAKGSSVDAFIDGLESWQQDIARSFAELIARTVPTASSYVKWGHPVWDHGGPFALLKPARSHVTLGFWRGGQLRDADRVLEGDGAGMRYVRLRAGEKMPASLSALVREAVTLNDKHGNPLER